MSIRNKMDTFWYVYAMEYHTIPTYYSYAKTQDKILKI